MVKIEGRTFTDKEVQIAQENIQRGIAGQRMKGFQQKGISRSRSKLAFDLLLRNPQLRRQFEAGRQAKTEARVLRFVGKGSQRAKEVAFLKQRAKEVGLRKTRQEIARRRGKILPDKVIIKKVPPTKRPPIKIPTVKKPIPKPTPKKPVKAFLKKQVSIAPENIQRLKRIKAGFTKTIDIISGGSITERKLSKENEKINKQVETFNRSFGDRELSETEFNIAQKQKKQLESNISNLSKKQKDFNESTVKRIGNLVWGAGALFPKGQPEGVRVNMGTVPITPAVGLPRNVKVSFLGTQRQKGNKIITDVIFKSGNKRVGFAKGVTIQSGKKGTSVVLGKSGVQGIKFPSGKTKLLKQQVFKGAEIGITKPTPLATKTQIDLVTKARKGASINVIKNNIKGFQQAGVGRIAQAKGKSFVRTGVKFPTGKPTIRPRRLELDDFASMSAVLTRGEISKIIGKTITAKGDKAKFIGLIKGIGKTGKGFKVSGTQRLQFQKALQNVASVISASLSEADKLSGISKAMRLATASASAKNLIKKSTPSQLAQLTKLKVTPKPVVIPKPKPKPKPPLVKPDIVTKTRVTTLTSQVSKQLSEAKQKVDQITKEITKAKQKGEQVSKSKSSQKQTLTGLVRNLQSQKLALQNLTPSAIATGKIPPFLLALLKKKKKKKKLKPTKKPKKQAYNVKARPLKKKGAKKKPKLKKVNKVPLSKKRAKDMRNYLVDTSLSRTGKIEKSKGKPKKTKLKIPRGYAKKTKKKFRKHKIVKGKKVRLPRGTIIEKTKHALDTKQEKKGISLRKRIAQLKKPEKKKPTKKRKPSKKQLEALKKGRLKRMKNLRKK